MYPSEHMVFSWGGTFGNPLTPVEIFTGSMRFALTGGGLGDVDSVDNDDYMMKLSNDLRAYWVKPAARIPSQAQLRYVKWNRVGTDGKYVNQYGSRRYDYLEPLGGGNSTVFPYQIACCVTWQTDRHRGLGAKGRTYFPTSATLESGSGRIVRTDAEGISIAAAGLIAAWSNAEGLDTTALAPVVGSKAGAGALRPIQSVGVGQVFDTMRSRRNAMPESRVITNVPNA